MARAATAVPRPEGGALSIRLPRIEEVHAESSPSVCVLLTRVCGMRGLATLAIDLPRTHATNPCWSGHARFYVVWQSMNMALLSALEIGLIW
jgi:hypothetical protein